MTHSKLWLRSSAISKSRLCITRVQCKTKYQILGQIGAGKFSKVYKAESKANRSKVVAIKQIDLNTITPEEKNVILYGSCI